MRQIDANALLSELEALNKEVDKEAAYTGDRSLSVTWDNAIQAIKSAPTIEPEQRWIPCSERLPDEKDAGILKKLGIEKRSEDVLATVEVKGERMTVTTCTYDGKWEWDMKYAFPDYKVIAWMPLPEPYGGDQNG